MAIEAISGEEATAVKAVAVDSQDATAAEALPSSPPPSPSPEEVVTPGEKTPLVKEKTLAEKIAPLAEKIAEYILDHQDDAAQEDRWRTIMKRDMTKSFHKVEKDMQAQREEIHKEVQGRLVRRCTLEAGPACRDSCRRCSRLNVTKGGFRKP